jgi:hypothetical protein
MSYVFEISNFRQLLSILPSRMFYLVFSFKFTKVSEEPDASKTLVNFYQITQHYTPEDSTSVCEFVNRSMSKIAG